MASQQITWEEETGWTGGLRLQLQSRYRKYLLVSQMADEYDQSSASEFIKGKFSINSICMNPGGADMLMKAAH